MEIITIFLPLQSEFKKNGTLAEWLGNGLQNRVRRFESARYLKKMKRLIFVLIISSLCAGPAFSQIPQSSLYEMKRAMDLMNLNKAHRGDFQSMLTEADIQGSPYLNDEFIEGSVFTTSKTQYEGVPLRYNIYNDDIEFRSDDGQVMVLAAPEVLEKVEFGDYQFEYIFYHVVNKTRRGFFTVIEKGKASLYSRPQIKFEEAKQPAAYQDAQPAKFTKRPDVYYIRIDMEAAKPVTKQKDLQEAFSDHKAEIASFIKKNKIKANSPESLKELVQYYNSLE